MKIVLHLKNKFNINIILLIVLSSNRRQYSLVDNTNNVILREFTKYILN